MDTNVTPPVAPAPTTPPEPSASIPTQATPSLSSSEALQTFAQNLLIEKGAVGFDADLLEGMKQDILDRLEVLTTKVILDALNDADLDTFESMVDQSASPDELQAFAASKIPDLAQRLTEALVRFRTTYLGSAA